MCTFHIEDIYNNDLLNMLELQGVAITSWHIPDSPRLPVAKTKQRRVSLNATAHNPGYSPSSTPPDPPSTVMAEQDPGDRPPDSRPPAYNGPFLFVNKNATNLRSRQRDEVFAVRSHAMQIARRSRKPPAQQKSPGRERPVRSDSQASDTAPAQDGAESPATEPIPSIQEVLEQQAMDVLQYQQRQSQGGPMPQPRRQSATARQGRSTPSFSAPAGSSFSAGANASRLLPAEHAASLARLMTTTSSPSGMSPGVQEPNTGQATGDIFFNSTLRFWRLGYLSNFWPARIYLDPAHRVVQATDGWLHGIVINNPAMLHGLFAGALSYITNHLPPTENTPMLWARAIHHYGKCLEETRTQLAQPGIGSEQALSLIHGMSTFSFHCQDLEACQVHRAASLRLLRSQDGGIESIHPVLKYFLILGETLVASHVPRRPSMDIDSWAPKPWALEPSLREFDEEFSFDGGSSRHMDTIIFLLDNDHGMNEYSEDLLELINWHREALAANELAFRTAHTSSTPLSAVMEPVAHDGGDRADPIYTWLSLRQYALNCLCSDMFVDLLELGDPGTSLVLKLQRVYHSSMLLASSYLTQFVMRRDMDSPSMAYIPYHHLRTQLELLLALMSRHRRSPISTPGQDSAARPPVNPIPTDGLLFLFFAGALGEEADGPSRVRAAHHIARAGVAPSPALEHPGDIINDRWFSVHFSMVLQRLGIDTWDKAQRVLKRYVYAERVLDNCLQVLVAKKLEFLAALVGGVSGGGFMGRTGFVVDPGGHGVAGHQATGTSSRAGPSQIPGLGAPVQVQADMPLQLDVPVSIYSPEQAPDTLPLFGPTPVSLSAAVPSATANWWQEMGYDFNAEDFSMDLDLHLTMDAGLEDVADLQGQGAALDPPDGGHEG